MSGLKIKKGDQVIVLSGKDKGKKGEVIAAFPAENKVIVEGVNVAKRHTKPRKAGDSGGIIDKAMPIDASKVAIDAGGKPSRVGFKVAADGSKTRIAKRTGGSL